MPDPREVNALIHDLLAERASLRQQVYDLEVELETARQMLRGTLNAAVPLGGRRTA